MLPITALQSQFLSYFLSSLLGNENRGRQRCFLVIRNSQLFFSLKLQALGLKHIEQASETYLTVTRLDKSCRSPGWKSWASFNPICSQAFKKTFILSCEKKWKGIA